MAEHHRFGQSTTTSRHKRLLPSGSLLGLRILYFVWGLGTWWFCLVVGVLSYGCSLIWVLGFEKDGIFAWVWWLDGCAWLTDSVLFKGRERWGGGGERGEMEMGIEMEESEGDLVCEKKYYNIEIHNSSNRVYLHDYYSRHIYTLAGMFKF